MERGSARNSSSIARRLFERVAEAIRHLSGHRKNVAPLALRKVPKVIMRKRRSVRRKKTKNNKKKRHSMRRRPASAKAAPPRKPARPAGGRRHARARTHAVTVTRHTPKFTRSRVSTVAEPSVEEEAAPTGRPPRTLEFTPHLVRGVRDGKKVGRLPARQSLPKGWTEDIASLMQEMRELLDVASWMKSVGFKPEEPSFASADAEAMADKKATEGKKGVRETKAQLPGKPVERSKREMPRVSERVIERQKRDLEVIREKAEAQKDMTKEELLATLGKRKKKSEEAPMKLEKQEKQETQEVEEKKEEKQEEVTAEPSQVELSPFSLTLKREKKRMGLLGFLRSLNNIGMGKQRVAFVQNLAMMLNAGLPLVDAMKTLELEIRSRAMRKVVVHIRESVENGSPLWEAMDDQCCFSPYEIALVHVGEEAGNLARNMQYLSEQQEKDHALKQKVKMAMFYPAIVLVLMFVVVMGLGLFVLPNLVQVLFALNVELPFSTRVVIYVTQIFSTYGKTAVPASAGSLVLFLILAKYTPFRIVAQWLVFRIPGVGRLAREATIARFGVILGGLLEAGVPLVDALQSLEEVTHIHAYRRFYKKLVDRVMLGDSFAVCFREVHGSRKLLPASVQQLVITGEQSGTLAGTFLKVAQIYERKASETAEKLPVILEPMLLLIIGGLVGFIAFSIIVPIYSAVGHVSGQ